MKTKFENKVGLIFCLTLVFEFAALTKISAQASDYGFNYTFGAAPVNSSAYGFGVLDNASNSGQYNTGLGKDALFSLSTADFNTAFGYQASYNVTTGDANTGIGSQALFSMTGGINNTACGSLALFSATGDYNVGIGYSAGSGVGSGNNNTAAGYLVSLVSGSNNQTGLGNGATTSNNDEFTIGDAFVTLFECNVGVTVTSDARFKRNLNYEGVKGLDFILGLRPVAYNLNAQKITEYRTKHLSEKTRAALLAKDFSEPTALRRCGFIAQEVEAQAAKLGFDFEGVQKPQNENSTYALAYAMFVVPLVKAVQEQQTMLESFNKDLDGRASKIGAEKPEVTSAPNLSKFRMDANRPNPFSDFTTIRYYMPKEIGTAVLEVSDLSGKKIISQAVSARGESELELSSTLLSPGMYLYTMIGDGKVLGSKRMIVSRP